MVVPPAAVQRGPRGAYVYVVNQDNTTSRRNVTVGHEDAQASIITEGVKPGDRVVVDGASRLSDGSKVTIVQPGAAGSAPTSATGGARDAAAPGGWGGMMRMRTPPAILAARGTERPPACGRGLG